MKVEEANQESEKKIHEIFAKKERIEKLKEARVAAI